MILPSACPQVLDFAGAPLVIEPWPCQPNLFPTPRPWQTRRTQNPVLARGCGFKSHLRY
jgi:hypothetical protein